MDRASSHRCLKEAKIIWRKKSKKKAIHPNIDTKNRGSIILPRGPNFGEISPDFTTSDGPHKSPIQEISSEKWLNFKSVKKGKTHRL